MDDDPGYNLADLRAIARARELELAAATKQRQRSDARVSELEQVVARLRAVNGALLAEKTRHDDQRDRVRDLEEQAHRWAEGQQRLAAQVPSARESEVRNDLSVARGQLEAATAKIADLQARVAELESAPAPTGLHITNRADLLAGRAGRADHQVGGGDDVGFTVTGAAARRISDLVQQLTGVRTASFGAADMLELGLSNSVSARRDMDATYAHLCAALDKCYRRGQPRHTDWGALLAATLSDVVFAGDLLSKAWNDTVHAMHELVAADAQPPDAAAFPVSLRAGCLLSYVRLHLPALAEDVRAARAHHAAPAPRKGPPAGTVQGAHQLCEEEAEEEEEEEEEEREEESGTAQEKEVPRRLAFPSAAARARDAGAAAGQRTGRHSSVRWS